MGYGYIKQTDSGILVKDSTQKGIILNDSIIGNEQDKTLLTKEVADTLYTALVRTPQAQDVIDRMSSPTQTEIDAISTFIDALVAADQYQYYLEFLVYALSGANALRGFKFTDATNNGATLSTTDGASFNGIGDYIATGVDLSTDGGGIYTLNDAGYGCYVKEVTVDGTVRCLGGVYDGSYSSDMVFSTSIGQRIRVNKAPGGFVNKATQLGDDMVVSHRRQSLGSNVIIYNDGVSLGSDFKTADQVPSGEWFDGAVNSNGSAANFAECKIPIRWWSAGDGIDYELQNTLVRQFMIDLGVISS